MNLNSLKDLIKKKTEEKINEIEVEYKEKLQNLEKKAQKLLDETKSHLVKKIEILANEYYEKEKHKLEQRMNLQIDNFIINLLPQLEMAILNYYTSLPQDEEIKWYKEKLEIIFKKCGNSPLLLEIPKNKKIFFKKNIFGVMPKKIKIVENEQIKFGFRVIYEDIEVDLSFKSLCDKILHQKLAEIKTLLI